ncbi:MAG TPA: polysaccharide deacetylase family protein [Sandaracinaceae bacterium LLY-WYZ-13_1]|nr:polysaccharide deacetylase family protein [Sandaracinaceae bacterium LLY-WYZ-13_1]
MRLAAVSVDLDEIGCYTAIHGLEPPDPAAGHAIYRRALPRLRRLFDEEGLPATFFAIGRDLEGDGADGNAEALRDLRADGHEIANHSRAHLYDLTRRPRAVIEDEVAGAIERIEAACGERPVGFRAPGYTITDAVFDVLADLGVRYDSSVFPCPAYYAAKTAAIGAIRARGRRSHSVVDDPRVLGAPADPYRVGRPYWRRGGGLLELPIGVTRGPRLPFIGTSVVLSGEMGARWLTRATIGRPLVNLELHGIDLADADEDGLGFLAPHQPDLRRSARAKAAALRAAVRELRGAGYRFVTLREAAEAFGGR